MKNKLPDQITISWHIDDVKSVADDLTDEECRKVLRLLESEHDATIGINWDVIEEWAQRVRENRKTCDMCGSDLVEGVPYKYEPGFTLCDECNDKKRATT